MKLRKSIALLLLLSLSTLVDCSREEEPQKVSFGNRIPIPARQSARNDGLRFAVGGMITPKEGLAYYKNFLDYIGEKLGRPVDFVDRQDYGEINNMLRTGNLDVAFVCSGPYVDGHDNFGLELLVAPSAFGGAVYHSYIIVNKNSPIATFPDLRGKKFAFSDPLSNSGKLAPTYMLGQMGETPDSFFQDYLFTRSHDNSIKAVALGLVDGAAVDSLIWEFLNRTNPEYTALTRIIEKSPPYGIPPVVVTRTMDPQLKERLRQIFLEADSDEAGREILNTMMIDKFVVPANRDYESVREMKSWLKTRDDRN